MRAHVAQKILPLALCFAVGVALAGAVEHSRSANRPGDAGPLEVSEAHSRTWLVIRSRATPSRPVISHGAGGFYSAHLRVKFGADGKVSEASPALGMEKLPVELIVRACDDMKRVKFTPPTEDGRPLAAVADVIYEAHVSCGRGPLEYSRCEGGYAVAPTNFSVRRIVSVEGAKESEGWRVVYE